MGEVAKNLQAYLKTTLSLYNPRILNHVNELLIQILTQSIYFFKDSEYLWVSRLQQLVSIKRKEKVNFLQNCFLQHRLDFSLAKGPRRDSFWFLVGVLAKPGRKREKKVCYIFAVSCVIVVMALFIFLCYF